MTSWRLTLLPCFEFLYVQHMANQRLRGLPRELIKKGQHFILIRNPLYVLVSPIICHDFFVPSRSALSAIWMRQLVTLVWCLWTMIKNDSCLFFRFCQPSFHKIAPVSFIELGFVDLVTIYNELCELGKPPPIIDAADLQENPEVHQLSTISLLYHKNKKAFDLQYYMLCRFLLIMFWFLRRHLFS